MTGYRCGFCEFGQHEQCTGLLRAAFGFCACADRDHGDRRKQIFVVRYCPHRFVYPGVVRSFTVIATDLRDATEQAVTIVDRDYPYGEIRSISPAATSTQSPIATTPS